MLFILAPGIWLLNPGLAPDTWDPAPETCPSNPSPRKRDMKVDDTPHCTFTSRSPLSVPYLKKYPMWRILSCYTGEWFGP
jgi:hypothetical protein